MSVWPKESSAIEMYQVRWSVGNPYLCLPSDFPQVAGHNCLGRKSCDVNQPSRRCGEQIGQLCMAFAINWAVACHAFNQYQLLLVWVIKNHIRHLAVCIYNHS